jgi:hypothetical protein
VFQAEDTERSIHIKIIDDDTIESDEQFLLQLSPNKDERVCLNQSNTAIITILDDDSTLLIKLLLSTTFAIEKQLGLKPHGIVDLISFTENLILILYSILIKVVWLLQG